MGTRKVKIEVALPGGSLARVLSLSSDERVCDTCAGTGILSFDPAAVTLFCLNCHGTGKVPIWQDPSHTTS